MIIVIAVGEDSITMLPFLSSADPPMLRRDHRSGVRGMM